MHGVPIGFVDFGAEFIGIWMLMDVDPTMSGDVVDETKSLALIPVGVSLGR